MTYVGRGLNRVDGPDKVRGAAHYAAEFQLPGMAHGVIVPATVARGSVSSVRLAEARKAPGVVRVYTHETFPSLQTPKANRTGKADDVVALQSPDVAFDGQAVALVVAETLEQAVFAAHLVEVDYQAGEPFIRMQDNLGAAFRPEEHVGKPLQIQRGNLHEGLANAAVVHQAVYTTPIENHHPMEPHASIAAWEQGRLILYTGTQGVQACRDQLAGVLGIKPSQIIVRSPFLGGGFGSKGRTWAHAALCAAAARDLKRPISVVQHRRQMFSLNGHRPATYQELTLAANAEGKLQGLRHFTRSHTSLVGQFVESAGLCSSMLYACPNVEIGHELVPIHVGTPTFMRGPGEAPGTFALECAMDELAFELGMDPLELRLINHAEKDPESGKHFSSKHLLECYQRGSEAFGWTTRKQSREGHLLIGQGMATATYPGNRQKAAARATLRGDGTAEVATATHDLGTGTYTIMTQIAADALGLPPTRIRFLLGDSTLPTAPLSAGSMTAASVGPAVREACLGLRAKLWRLSGLAARPFEEIEAADGTLFWKNEPKRREPFDFILRTRALDHLQAEAEAAPGPEKEKYSFHSFGAVFAEVAVDEDLGRVAVRRVVGAYDVGRILNRKTARSQAIGGIIFGIGMALLEETRLHPVSGRLVTRNLADYLLPVNADVPPIEVHFVEYPDPHLNALGSRGLGEIGNTGIAAAIVNAIFHATGKRVRDLPVTLDKLL